MYNSGKKRSYGSGSSIILMSSSLSSEEGGSPNDRRVKISFTSPSISRSFFSASKHSSEKLPYKNLFFNCSSFLRLNSFSSSVGPCDIYLKASIETSSLITDLESSSSNVSFDGFSNVSDDE